MRLKSLLICALPVLFWISSSGCSLAKFPALKIGGSSLNAGKVAAGRVAQGRNMTTARAVHTATLLPNGKVLIAGGMERNRVFFASAELYDPVAELYAPTGSMTTKRASHTATLLRNGKVLIAGGGGDDGQLASAEIYDPASGTFSATGTMNAKRSGHTATLLADGKVLVAGGAVINDMLASAEIYDPSTGVFKRAGNMTMPRVAHAAVLLTTGDVLIAGGSAHRGDVLSSAEIYNPSAGAFTKTGDMSVVRHKLCAILLRDGRVLVTGGSDNRDWQGRRASAEIYDPQQHRFVAAGDMNTTRFKHPSGMAMLPDGKILVASGSESVEVYDPATSAFGTVAGGLDGARFFGTVTLLQNGKALIAGGYGYGTRERGPEGTAQTWIYQP